MPYEITVPERVTFIEMEIIKNVYDVEYFIPLFKDITKKTFVYGRNRVNLHYLNCSCKIFRQKAGRYKRRDYRRICKHIYFFISIHLNEKLDEFSRLILETQFWYGTFDLKKMEINQEEIFFGINMDSQKIFFLQKTQNWSRLIYDLEKSCWQDEKQHLHLEAIKERVLRIYELESVIKLNTT